MIGCNVKVISVEVALTGSEVIVTACEIIFDVVVAGLTSSEITIDMCMH